MSTEQTKCDNAETAIRKAIEVALFFGERRSMAQPGGSVQFEEVF